MSAHPIHRTPSYPWQPDNGDGTYSNPVLHADYSDPDVIRQGGDFWMIASSFNCAPGLPVLHSKDLVNWKLVHHAIDAVPDSSYGKVRKGCGVWAPAIRYHAGKFWIFFPMPDEGIYVTCATHPAGEWEKPWCLAQAKGWIDPCPFWDDDGQAYLVHAYAMSRSGLKERIHLRPMSPDCRSLTGECRELFHTPHHLYLEGPKVHKIDGWYYILCPGGGVQTGWQVAFRSKNLFGPYEEKIVLEQGTSPVNGPHQGALVDLPDGSWWFLHFQDCGPFGRIVHLQPVRWQDGWPMMGELKDGICQPVARWQKPVQGFPPAAPPTGDDFSKPVLGLQWQWHANPDRSWYSLADNPGSLRLFAGRADSTDISLFPRFLGQKFPARRFRVLTDLDASGLALGGIAGLGVTSGDGSHFLAVRQGQHGRDLVLRKPEGMQVVLSGAPAQVLLSAEVHADGQFQFFYQATGGALVAIPEMFVAKEGGWIGAKIGLFHMSESDPAGQADFSRFELTDVAPKEIL